ncbi:MAG: bifunctional (p)ppGpp synthetase/guanosine-3',5'-bis(diphosphate) 3'-pyrophosphohydrolase [Pseudomonadota bacterium]
MMRQYELVERVQFYKPNANEVLLNKAYVYAMKKHGGQTRASGDPYFSHPLEVAAILTDLHLDEETIAVALLHDTIEDTSATRREIGDVFGPNIAKLVDGLTKIKKLDLVSKKTAQAENLRRLLLAISQDVRVLLVKLADRLHNMRTLGVMRQDKRARIAEETMEIYAPLAGRMGMQDMRDELEDLSFRNMNPEGYALVTDRLKEQMAVAEPLLEEITATLRGLLADNGIHADVRSRRKRPWSIFKKMETKGIAFEQLSDLFGFRILVDTEDECYRTLGIVHRRWSNVPGRFKDYISIPKQNDYRSLHTTIVGPSKQRVELQIRSHEMHRVAEYGVAAHTIYKDTAGKDGHARVLNFEETQAYAWLRETIEALSEGDHPEQVLENTKLELFQDQVLCFTPKGKLISLPAGATPVDFAYAVHTDVGNSCIGAKINGRIMPLVTRLESGDEVEIICSASAAPPAAWESMVVTGKARSSIRRATRAAVRLQYAGQGFRNLQKAFERAGRAFSRDVLSDAISWLAFDDIDDLLAAVGRGEVPPSDVIKAVYRDEKSESKSIVTGPLPDEGWAALGENTGMVFKLPDIDESSAYGLKRMPRDADGQVPVIFSKEGAVPGDRIVGISTPGKGVVVYPIQSSALASFDDQPDRWIDIRWDQPTGSSKDRFNARVAVNVSNEPGMLAAVATIIAESDANIDSLSMVRSAPDFTEMIIDVEVWDIKHLNRLLRTLRSSPSIGTADRMYG